MDAKAQRRIEEIALQLLARADADGRVPTPLDDVLAARGLSEPEDSLLAPEQIAKAPAHIRGLISRLASKVRGLVDRRAREVHFDPTVTQEPRRRFWKAHEIIHDALPWQRELAYVDDDYRLSPEVHLEFELQASQGGAELLYQGKRFASDAAEFKLGMAAVVASAQRYHVSIESALWRYVETNRDAVLGVVLDPSPISREPLRYKRRKVTRSLSFGDRFGRQVWPSQLEATHFGFLNEAAGSSAGGCIVSGAWRRRDLAGQEVNLRTECLATGYAILVLIWVPKKHALRRKVVLVA